MQSNGNSMSEDPLATVLRVVNEAKLPPSGVEKVPTSWINPELPYVSRLDVSGWNDQLATVGYKEPTWLFMQIQVVRPIDMSKYDPAVKYEEPWVDRVRKTHSGTDFVYPKIGHLEIHSDGHYSRHFRDGRDEDVIERLPTLQELDGLLMANGLKPLHQVIPGE